MSDERKKGRKKGWKAFILRRFQSQPVFIVNLLFPHYFLLLRLSTVLYERERERDGEPLPFDPKFITITNLRLKNQSTSSYFFFTFLPRFLPLYRGIFIHKRKCSMWSVSLPLFCTLSSCSISSPYFVNDVLALTSWEGRQSIESCSRRKECIIRISDQNPWLPF